MTAGRELVHVDADDWVRSHAIAGVVSVWPGCIVTSWCVPPVWQSLLDQYVSAPLVIVNTCCADPRSMWHADEPEFVIDIDIFGSCVGPYADASTMGLSTIWLAEHAPAARAGGAAEADAVAAPDAAALASPAAPEAAAEAEAEGSVPGVVLDDGEAVLAPPAPPAAGAVCDVP